MLTKITIYEDNETLRKGLEELLTLSDEFVVTGSYGNCMQVLEQLKENRYNLMDIDMPGMTNIEAVRK